MRRELGRTGRTVHAIGLGAMPLSLQGRPSPEVAYEVIAAFLEGGGDLIDTANAYCLDQSEVGHNERLVAEALRRWPRRADVLVATKGGVTRDAGGWGVDGRPASLRAACERSLRDLGVDCIELYQLHAPDPRVPFAESVGALARLREEGKIRHVGLSNVDTAQLAAAQAVVRIESVQNRCHLFRKSDLRNGLIAACAEQGVAYIAHSPVGGHVSHERLGGDERVAEIARAHGATAPQIALAWLLALGEHVIPIPGASRVASVQASLAAQSLRLSEAELHVLSALRDW